MKFGVTMFMTDETVGPAALGRAVEERGFDSVFIPEHTHIPTLRSTPPPTGEGDLPEGYKRTLDPFVALAAMAAVTDRIRLGTGVCVLAQHEPIVTAKAAATLDHISGGRLDLGVGYGWNADEIAHHGVGMRDRRDVLREHALAMQALWQDEVAEFHGDFVDFGPSWSWPKPVQPDGVPILLGGAPGPTLLRHVAEFGAGWIPFGGSGVADALGDLADACADAGRDMRDLRICLFGVVADPPGKLAYYESLGVSEVVLRVPAGGADIVLPALDALATVVQAHQG